MSEIVLKMVTIMSKSKQYNVTLCNYDNTEMSMYNIFAVCNIFQQYKIY